MSARCPFLASAFALCAVSFQRVGAIRFPHGVLLSMDPGMTAEGEWRLLLRLILSQRLEINAIESVLEERKF